MYRFSFLTAAALAVMFFHGSALAAKADLLKVDAVNPVFTVLKATTTAQVNVPDIVPADFDALSSINDPLYIEGSRQLLEQSVKDIKPAEKARKPVMRDAPISKPGAGIKKIMKLKKLKIKKPVHTDPVRTKHAL